MHYERLERFSGFRFVNRLSPRKFALPIRRYVKANRRLTVNASKERLLNPDLCRKAGAEVAVAKERVIVLIFGDGPCVER